MKRKMAFLLAAALILNTGLTAYASETESVRRRAARQEQERGRDIAESSNSGAEPAGRAEAGKVGQVDVVVGTALLLRRSVDFAVSLTGPDGVIHTETVTLGADSLDSDRVSFEGLASGDYYLTVTAPGFAAYGQTIAVGNKACTVNLMTGFLDGISYEEGVLHPGVLLIGDVNGDGANDAADSRDLVDAIDSGISSGLADLNGDGYINLIDLDYFVRGYGETRDTAAGVEHSVPAAVITAGVGAGTVAEGDLRGLLLNSESVRLKPADGQAISEENPVILEFDFTGYGADVIGDAAMADGIILETGGDNPVSSAVISIAYTDENGAEGEVSVPVEDGVHFLLKDSDVYAERDSQGNIRLHLGTQVTLKKVTFVIRGMKNNNLAEISKVEFVNGMEERIPAPEMDIPENLRADAGSRRITLTWEPCVNVTGYEVLIKHGNSQEKTTVTGNALTVTSFGGKELTNYLAYQVKVQAVNGTWRSGYGEEITAVPKPDGKPDRPDNVSAAGDYESIRVSWKLMKDTLTYNLYYRKSSEEEYRVITGITGNSFTIDGLEDLTEYTVYVTGVNEFGESAPSLTAAAVTTDADPAVMPKYNLINTGEKGAKGDHIVSASGWSSMENSSLDTESGTAWGTVDHDAGSYYLKNSWDDGGFNPKGGPLNQNNGLLYEFDQAYKLDTIAFHDMTSRDTGYFYVKVRWWDENGTATNVSGASLQRRTDAEGRTYYVIKLPEAVTAKKLQFGLARYSASGNITVSEVYFYYYDTLADEIMALYEDDLHTVLRADVTQATIDALRTRINTPDPVSGEYHPDRALLERELQNAEAILKDTGLNAPVTVHCGISTNDAGRGFGGLNSWQPLKVTAAAGEEIMVFVGHNTKKTGEAADLELVATQYHSEAGNVSSVVTKLKVGANKVTVPKLSSTACEAGGALYVQYTGSNDSDRYAVRVSGGVAVPGLDLYGITDENERLARAKAYVEALQTYVSGMEATHNEAHAASGINAVKYAYDATNCILGASDILSDTMMLSLPAQQILAGAGSGSTEEQARRILNSMDTVENMMYLFYQHKGLNAAAPDLKDRIPKGHLNIRYQRMFSGAFMYASGNHIGIEWGSAPGMMGGVSVTADAEGRYQSGSYFGWGIAHEIGHCINQGAYAVAEITNNYYAVLAQAKDNNGSVRFSYDEVYRKVTSGTKGRASNVFTQLGMYWQLHLAYDKGYNYKTYTNYEEQLQNLFFARMDTYARDTSRAPMPKNVALTLNGGTDQNLMRLACAAAQKDLTEFFTRWGMTPDEGTLAYAGQFEKEARAIYYVSDDSRVYSQTHGGSSLNAEGTVEAVGDGVRASVSAEAANRVDISLSLKTIPAEDLLGYEIVRCIVSGGEVEREPVGFTAGNTFSDTVATMNNRTVYYEITVIDKYLNRSAVKVTETLKIEHDGSLDKSFWTASARNLIVEGEASSSGSGDSLCSAGEEDLNGAGSASKQSSIGLLIDNRTDTVWTAAAGGEAEIVLEFNRSLTVTGLKYTVGESLAGVGYEVQVRSDGAWLTTASGSFAQGNGQTVYFGNEDGKYVSTYRADALKLILRTQSGGSVSVAELDVLGVTGDNVDFRRTGEGTAVIGRLKEAYVYDTETGAAIPAGSIVFAGAYKGNPAYNVAVLYDRKGNIVGGTDSEGNLKAQQIILADVPEEGAIQNVSDGTWIYWIAPEEQADPAEWGAVRVELYRVNNALTNAGQRLVSDSLYENVPETLPEISLESAVSR